VLVEAENQDEDMLENEWHNRKTKFKGGERGGIDTQKALNRYLSAYLI
jgi:hypothetical protein